MLKINELKHWGMRRCLTLKQVAEIAGLTTSTAGKYNAGYSQPSADKEKEIRRNLREWRPMR